ncbi:3'(2'),5'-bisphosphate nucleotidase CysQ [Helicobacter aurati]|uniref:3'(2'),5'-bisphosphate nucleotidase CysQ n=1 Tax=Helicobacter aurati TaxID=137778 RepID=A0A3D8IXY5_9HELI|nr:3'(2'),5'-bisphosphate nucleotidase CysQ [Helicobacter aurati]RDU69836.1 3'(2'),5'-bisphosphate nucleotidase CysQ [Helicobacter aurati]
MLSTILYDVISIAIKAGEIALNIYQKCHNHSCKIDLLLKEDSTPITQADRESNAYIMEKLATLYSYEICSEEAILEYAKRKDLEYYWLIDPLDGTKEFIAGIGEWTINIALVHKSDVVLGVVYAPCLDELYFAEQGYGSFYVETSDIRNNTESQGLQIALLEQSCIRLHGGSNNLSQNSRIIACSSRFHDSKATNVFIEKYNLEVIHLGSSLKICALASGKAEIYPRFNGTKEWDTAASDIILRESGGIILDFQEKKPLTYNKKTFANNHFVAFNAKQIGGTIYQDILKYY